MQHNISLQQYNTFGIDCRALQFTTFNAVEKLVLLLQEIRQQNLPIKILGGGSNILLTQQVNAIVLKNECKGIAVVEQLPNQHIIQCGAGEQWHAFVLWSLAQGYGGIENLSLIPGTVGAAPMQNIGAYGVEIKDVFHSLDAVEISSGALHTFNAEQCAFGYRESVFKRQLKDQYVIVAVRFHLQKQALVNTNYGDIKKILDEQGIIQPTATDVSNAVISIRQSKLPNPEEIGNAGSFFKNPVIDKNLFASLQQQYATMPSYTVGHDSVKVPAGWLIEQCGWKGYRNNNYGVHSKQALVLVNYGGASGEELFNLSGQIIESVKNKFNIELEREVNIW